MKNSVPPPALSFACPKKWEGMSEAGDGRRFCEQCQKHVHDLSAMTGPEVRRHFAGPEASACVSYLVRLDGSLATRPRWPVAARAWRAVRWMVMAAVAAVTAAGFTACSSHDTAMRTGGKVCVAPDDMGGSTPDSSYGRTTGEPMPQRTAGVPLAPTRNR